MQVCLSIHIIRLNLNACIPLRALILSILFLSACTTHLMAQSPGTWKIYPSLRTINDIVSDQENNIWAATQGGILKYDRLNISQFTTQDGLSRPDSRSITYDPLRQQLFIGYVNGLIDVVNTGNETVTVIEDIERASTQ